jgi:hypothetical protein
MAEVIKEVTKELQEENAIKEGRTLTIKREEDRNKKERGSLSWNKQRSKAEAKLKKELEMEDEEDEGGADEKKGMFEVAKKWGNAKNGKSATRKKYGR